MVFKLYFIMVNVAAVVLSTSMPTDADRVFRRTLWSFPSMDNPLLHSPPPGTLVNIL